MPASLPLAKVAVMMVLALSRLMRKSLMGVLVSGCLFRRHTDRKKRGPGKALVMVSVAA